MTDRFPASEFWDFSVRLYAKPEVAPACLGLQDRHGVDVNALMFCLWLAASGRGPVPRERLEDAFAAVAEWHRDVVRPLRDLRRRLKQPVGRADHTIALALRARVQKVEIDAEHVEQLTLGATKAAALPVRSDAGPEAAGHAARHAAAYFALIGAKPGAEDLAALEKILIAAFPGAPAAMTAHIAGAFA
jgi:uncharacterized protein (TIGR02444 family)